LPDKRLVQAANGRNNGQVPLDFALEILLITVILFHDRKLDGGSNGY
jgi:hypothetical protein